MTSALDLLIRVLSDNSDVAAIVGTRIFGIVAPQTKAMPYIVCSLIYEDQDVTLEGHQDGYDSRVSVECVASSVTNAVELGETVKSALSIAHHPVLSDDIPAEELGRVTLFKEGTDVTDYTQDRSTFRRFVDFRMRWTR